MNSSHYISSAANRRLRNRRGGMTGGLIACLILIGVLGAIGYRFFADDESKIRLDDLITAKATRSAFDHIVLEQGEIASSSNQVVTCEVESRGSGGTSILWVIDEGSKVKEGNKLVELDSSQLELNMKEKKIRVITAESNVATAEALVEQAKIAREEYLKGVYETDAKALESEKALAEQELRKATLARDSSKRLAAKGLVKSLQLEADRFAVANAQNKLDAAKQKLWVLENLTKQKMLVQFDSDIDAAEASLSAAKAELVEEEQELGELEDQISKCILYAPSDGVVVHANRYSSRGGNAEFVVEAGATVRERQEIIKLPDPTQMHVDCKINESRITLIDDGMPSLISVDAIPGLELKGRVKKVNRYAEPGSWFSSSTKEYTTLVEIINPPETIRTGMTAEVQIFVEQLEDALQVPIQALYEHGEQMYCLVRRGGKEFETVPVTLSATNSTMAAIESGLEEGDVVVLNLRENLSLMDLPELERQDNSDLRELRNEPKELGGDGPSEPRGERPGDGGQGGSGEPGAARGGPGGGGFNPAMIANRIMESMDSDGDGQLSSEEVKGGDERRSQMLSSADKDGDGNVSKAEVLQALKAVQSRMQSGGGGGGPPSNAGGGR